MVNNPSSMKEAWALADKRQFCKQSCTKIDQGLRKLDNRSSERAIWELFQNARDLALCNAEGEKEAHIKITVTSSELIFAHKGRPFTHDTFSSLVKQVSAQEKENEESVGQYGTGFLTTHSFGRKILVNGSLDLENFAPGKFVSINNFEMDRVYDNIDSFIDKMANQLLEIDKFADALQTTERREWTELRYQLESADRASEKVDNGIAAAIKVMPYVMTVNEPIGDVEIIDEVGDRRIKFSKEYLKEENGLKVVCINVDNNGSLLTKKIYYLQSEDKNDIAILPLKDATHAESLNGIAKLFVFFPLLGTENFGMDVVFHSKRFYPTEERDAVYLPVDNGNVKALYEANVKVLDEMSRMVFDYLSIHALEIENWEQITSLSFECKRNKEDITNDFFRLFKTKWVGFFEKLPIVSAMGDRKCLSSGNVNVYANELIRSVDGENAQWESALYDAATVYGNVPSRELIKAWSHVVATWYNGDEQCFLTFGKLASKLEAVGEVSSSLLMFDKFVKASGRAILFEEYSLIPNRTGCLHRKSELVNAESIPAWVCDLVKYFVPDEVEKFVDSSFVDVDTFSQYSRNDLRSHLNEALATISKQTLRKSINPTMFDANAIIALAKICNIVPNANMRNYYTEAMNVICNHLGLDYAPIELAPTNSDERNLTERPFQYLVENLLMEISRKDTEWIVENIDYALSLHEALSKWAEYYSPTSKEGYAVKYGAYPNMLNEPTVAAELKKGVNIPNKLMELYKAVFGVDLKVQLVNPNFETFCDFAVLDASGVAKEIEEELEKSDFQNDSVLDIIDSIDNDHKWASWFPRISEKKADIFMKQVKPDCKDSVYRLMKVGDPEKLEQLADLAGECDMNEIVRLGKAAILQRQRENADFEYKKKLGKYIENSLEKSIAMRLGASLAEIANSVEVVNEQWGHDLAVKVNGEDVFYIEVKSRWGSNQSVELSPLQLKSCVENADKYALCCVNMMGMDQQEAQEHEYPDDLEETISKLKAITTIGNLAAGLETVVKYTEDNLHIGGSFSCVVPQKIINAHGISFEELMQVITEVCINKGN